MEKYPASKVAITGYADKETGNPRINMTLSEKRAKIVADALKDKGIAPDRIVTDLKEIQYSLSGCLKKTG